MRANAKRERILEFPRDWDPLIERACREYVAAGRGVQRSVAARRVYNFMKAHPKDYAQVFDYIANCRDDFVMISLLKRINDATKLMVEKGELFRDESGPESKQGGALYFAEYDLAASEDVIGPLYPVLEDEKGNILDGAHRLQTDPDWPKKTVKTGGSREKALLIRYHANMSRRAVAEYEKEEYVAEARAILRSKGRTGTQREIAEFLGISESWVQLYDEKPTRPYSRHTFSHEGRKIPSLGESQKDAKIAVNIRTGCAAGEHSGHHMIVWSCCMEPVSAAAVAEG